MTLEYKILSAHKWIKLGYKVTIVLKILRISRSTYYSKQKYIVKRSYANVGRKVPGYSLTFDNIKISDITIQKYITEIRSKKTSRKYGYKKVTGELRFRKKYNLKINKKKVRRLMKNLNLLGNYYKRQKRRMSRTCESRKVTASNQLWQMDIKYAFIAGNKKTAYITSIIDVFDREIVAYSIDLSATGSVAKKVMLEALYNRGLNYDKNKTVVLRTDNGSQFISGVFEKGCLDEGVLHERIPVHSPNYNAFIESYHRYLQDECLTGMIYWNLDHIKNDVGDFVYRYNHERIHSSIGYIPPHDYYLMKLAA
ncbi:IS3 family transposase [Clostridium sp. BJN0001]|uniref:IS3 family transposase n=1 Tax=Clostridium sp. BJN0001 TaxID=2930219 RepID=UPI0032AFE8EC